MPACRSRSHTWHWPADALGTWAAAAVLARVLLQREPFRDSGEIRLLRRYERARAEDILALAFVTDGLQRLFAAPGRAAAKLRNAGLNLTNALPVVKNLLSHRALG